MEPVDAVQTLLDGLIFYRTQFLSSAYSTVGITVIAAGWLITSRSARVFIHSHRWLGMSGIGLLIVSFVVYWTMAIGVQSTSQRIADTLHYLLHVNDLYYKHYVLTPKGVGGFIFLQGMATLLLTLLIVGVMKDPGKA